MLNDENGVAQIHQSVQNLDKLGNVGGMKTGRRLIENVYGSAGTALGQFGSPASHAVLHRRKAWSRTDRFLYSRGRPRKASSDDSLCAGFQKKGLAFFDGHIEHIINVFSLVFDL